MGGLTVEGGTEYFVCPTSAAGMYGPGLFGSYSYVYTDGSVVNGYEEAQCFTPVVAAGSPVCMGLWYESGFMGVFMNVVASSDSTYDTWWGGLLEDVDYVANVGNSDEHAVELEEVTGVANSAQCSNYSSMYVVASSCVL